MPYAVRMRCWSGSCQAEPNGVFDMHIGKNMSYDGWEVCCGNGVVERRNLESSESSECSE
jgi:hypothetical protein